MLTIVYFALTLLFSSLQSRFIFGGDSAEYATVAKTWGIAHPPGYPLYSFLINLINSTIPFGSTPWRVAFLSSLPAILTSLVIFKLFLFLKINKTIAFICSLLYLFLFPIWQYALIPEVFSLHVLLVASITYLLLLYSKKPKPVLLYSTSFICGLCVSHHHIFVLFIPGWLLLLKEHIKRIYSDKKQIAYILSCLAMGASFYLYTVVVSLNHTILDWENAKTLSGFFSLITRSSYGTFKAYSSSVGNIVNQISAIVSGFIFILLDFKPLGIFFIVIGMVTSKNKVKQFSSFLFVTLILHFIFLFYANFILTTSTSSGMYERFLIPLYFLLIFYVGIGADYCYTYYQSFVHKKITNTLPRKIAHVCYFIFLSLFLFIIAFKNFKVISYIPTMSIFETFGKDIVDTVPNRGILITQGDTSTFSSSYHLYGLHKRQDIVFFQLGLMSRGNFIDLIKKRDPTLVISSPITNSEELSTFISQNAQRGIYAENKMSIGYWQPYGLLWKYYPDVLNASSESARLLSDNKKLWKKYVIPSLSTDEKNIFHLNSVREYYLNAYIGFAKLLVALNDYQEGENVLKNIAMHYMKNDQQSKAMYMNILVQEKKCKEATKIAHEINLETTTEKYPSFATSAISYIQTCDPHNKILPRLQKKLMQYEKSEKTNLNLF